MKKANAHTSKKAKGRALENWVASELRSSTADPKARAMPASGAFSHFKGDIYTRLPFHFECKNHESWKPKEWLRIAQQQAGLNETPVIVMKSNFEQPVALLDARAFIHIIAEIEQLYCDRS